MDVKDFALHSLTELEAALVESVDDLTPEPTTSLSCCGT